MVITQIQVQFEFAREAFGERCEVVIREYYGSSNVFAKVLRERCEVVIMKQEAPNNGDITEALRERWELVEFQIQIATNGDVPDVLRERLDALKSEGEVPSHVNFVEFCNDTLELLPIVEVANDGDNIVWSQLYRLLYLVPGATNRT